MVLDYRILPITPRHGKHVMRVVLNRLVDWLVELRSLNWYMSGAKLISLIHGECAVIQNNRLFS